jgi:hypothetical protein
MTTRTYARTDGKNVYAHRDASVAYRRLSEPTDWAEDEQQTSGVRIALAVLALCGTLGAIGWLFTYS